MNSKAEGRRLNRPERRHTMRDYEKAQIEKAVATINNTYKRVLIADLYEGYELRQLDFALKLLLKEVDKK